MTAENPTNAEHVQDFGLAIFGPEWGAGLGRLTGINARTMTRIKVSAQNGRDYPAAAGVLAALAETLDALALRATPFRRAAQMRPERAPTIPATQPAAVVQKPASGQKNGLGLPVQFGPTPVAPGSRLKKR